MNYKDKTFLISSTVRYTLGRQSYAVGWICDILKEEWLNISKNDRLLIFKDIKNYLQTKHVTIIDRIYWNKIIQLGEKDGFIR